MKKIFGYFKPYKWQSILGPLLKLAEATFELLVPFVVAAIVDNGFGEQINGAYPNADKSYIVWASPSNGGRKNITFIPRKIT